MTLEEFSNGFDVLVDSYRRFVDFDNKVPTDTIEFNEYEKSFYLTKSQEELVLSLYNGKNVFGDSFELTEEMRRHLSDLVSEVRLFPTENSTGILGLGSNSRFFTLPENLWFITYEQAVIDNGKCEGMTTMNVVPARQDEYQKLRNNPFRGANDRRCLRFDLSEGVIEIVSKYNVIEYYVRYLRKLKPIILEEMPDEASIGGITKATPCELHEGLHQLILERAIAMALQSKGIGISSQTKKEEK